MNTQELGKLGEQVACRYLMENGFKILAKNWKISFGEIDMVARRKTRFFSSRDRTIHFVEVKTILGSGQNYFPQDRVDSRKQRKLRQLCQLWLKQQKLPQDFPCQIDVVGITIDSVTQQPTINYFPNAVDGI